MRSNFFVAAVLVVSPALGHDVWLEPVDNATGGADALHPGFDVAGWRTFDLKLSVDDGDDWTTATLRRPGTVKPWQVAFGVHHGKGSVTDGVFFQHSLGGEMDPLQALVDSYPALAFDTFLANPPTLFDGDSGGVAGVSEWTPTSIKAMWYDTHRPGPGTFTIARFTFTGELWVEGYLTFRYTGGDLWGYSLTTEGLESPPLPEPAGLTLLGLAGLACRRRR